MKDFTNIELDRVLFHDDYFFIIKDAFPVSPGHMLIISQKVRETYFDLTEEERKHLDVVILKAKEFIEREHQPDGYNIGMNCGGAAGQTVFHFHCHVIPRYLGDMENPEGGIRHCIQGKGRYTM